MRKIKFRIYDKKFKKMHYEGFMIMMESGGSDLAFDPQKMKKGSYDPLSMELMQYTGLKDKNGKEIYEGDLLKASEDSKPFQVIFSDGCFVGQGKKNKTWYDLRIFEKNKTTIWTVVGNIYENQELLKGVER